MTNKSGTRGRQENFDKHFTTKRVDGKTKLNPKKSIRSYGYHVKRRIKILGHNFLMDEFGVKKTKALT